MAVDFILLEEETGVRPLYGVIVKGDGSREIVFEFVSGGKKSIITYRRKYQRPPSWVAS